MLSRQAVTQPLQRCELSDSAKVIPPSSSSPSTFSSSSSSPPPPPPSRCPLAASQTLGWHTDSSKPKNGTAEANESHSVGAVSQYPGLAGTLHSIALGLKLKIDCSMNFMGVGFFFFIYINCMQSDDEGEKNSKVCSSDTYMQRYGYLACVRHKHRDVEIAHMHVVNVHTHTTHARRGTSKGGLTAHCMKRTDVSEEDKIRDILWLKGWLGGCCRCTYSERVKISLLFSHSFFRIHSQ